MNKYSGDINTLVENNVKTFLRKPKRLAFIKALLCGYTRQIQYLEEKKKQIDEELSIRFQTGLMEYELNKRFYPDFHPLSDFVIYIENVGATLKLTYIHSLEENEENPYAFSIEEINSGEAPTYIISLEERGSDYDFIVKIPHDIIELDSELSTQADKDKAAEMVAFLNKYKFADKSFKLENY